MANTQSSSSSPSQSLSRDENFSQVSTIIKSSMTTAIGQIIEALEPQINELANQFAEQMVDNGHRMLKSAFREARRHPMILVGTAAILLVGAAVFTQINEADETETDHKSQKMLHA